ncbi:hypothetical protein QU487_18130 [Crenobacter sp. SG2305]|uniref:hypothetical protein n=1 Tax=Crenobacter oryzisoli TaxID=3056844 RepID=UPI0025AB2062|nr:hypothetical protein [Crenobacter sp. SG2305]MDN0084656.1 hypothetical protein [Crenobacter sp. SG2305]
MDKKTASSKLGSEANRVAVIAIHGVGEHEPGEMASAVAEQLLTVCEDEYRYANIRNLTLDVDVNGLNQARASSTLLGRYSLKRLLAGFDSGFRYRKRLAYKNIRDRDSVDQQFTSALLSEDDAYHSTYTTSCQTLQRNDSTTIVDVHELHWADLSHGSVSGSLRVFDQFTQLLLHIASLGRTTLATLLASPGEVGTSDSKLVSTLYMLSALGYWLLAMPILQGNLLFILLACLIFPSVVSENVLLASLAIAIGGTIACAAAIFSRWYLRGHIKPLVLVPFSLLVGIIGGSLVIVWRENLHHFVQHFARSVTTTFEAVLLLTIGYLLIRRYDRIRPGALLLWWGLVCLLILAGVGLALNTMTNGDPVEAFLTWLGHLTEIVYAFLVICWITLAAVNISLLVVGVWYGLRAKLSDKAQRAIATALIAASIPAPLLLSVILALWAMAFLAFEIPDKCFEPLFGEFFFPTVHSTQGFVKALIVNSATHVFVPYLVLMLVAVLLIAWGLLPSIKVEVIRPTFEQTNSTAQQARLLGRWLDGAFVSMRLGATLAGFGFFILLPYGVITQLINLPNTWSIQLKVDLIAIIGELIGGTTVGFLAGTSLFKKSFSNFFGRLRIAVDAALDVDNWLRERPYGNTPRLRIFARFNGLLRYLQTMGYKRIVIVAHSQGTVIAADFLRYLHFQVPKRLEELPEIHMLTLGSPLRQLYAWRFPYLYAWAGAPHGPNPNECGVVRWINLYGSGDYIGRSLWSTPVYSPALEPNQHVLAKKLDMCIGPQAHTHYFDADQMIVGKWINNLIMK